MLMYEIKNIFNLSVIKRDGRCYEL